MNAKARTGGKVAAIVEFPWEIVFLQKPLVIEKRLEPLHIGRFWFWAPGFELRVLGRVLGGFNPTRGFGDRGYVDEFSSGINN